MVRKLIKFQNYVVFPFLCSCSVGMHTSVYKDVAGPGCLREACLFGVGCLSSTGYKEKTGLHPSASPLLLHGDVGLG